MRFSSGGPIPNGSEAINVAIEFDTDLGDINFIVTAVKAFNKYFAIVMDIESESVVGSTMLEIDENTMTGKMTIEHYCGDFDVEVTVNGDFDRWMVNIKH